MKKLLLILLCLSTFLWSNNLKAQCTITATPTSCCNWCDGTASVSVTGGNPGYSYLWTGPPGFTATTSTVNGLCEGTYPVIAIDAIGDTVCNDTAVIVLSPNALVYNLTITPPSAPGLCDGSLTTNINGGSPPYSYLWLVFCVKAILTGQKEILRERKEREERERKEREERDRECRHNRHVQDDGSWHQRLPRHRILASWPA